MYGLVNFFSPFASINSKQEGDRFPRSRAIKLAAARQIAQLGTASLSGKSPKSPNDLSSLFTSLFVLLLLIRSVSSDSFDKNLSRIALFRCFENCSAPRGNGPRLFCKQIVLRTVLKSHSTATPTHCPCDRMILLVENFARLEREKERERLVILKSEMGGEGRGENSKHHALGSWTMRGLF